MKVAAFLSAILAIVPLGAAQALAVPEKDFVFELPSAIPNTPNPSASFHVNLTGISSSTFGGLGPANLTQIENQALTKAIESQMPDYLRAYKDVLKLSGQDDCDLDCCEEACFALIWIPFGTLICIKICEKAHEHDP